MKVKAEEIFNCTAEEYWERYFDEEYRRGAQIAAGAAEYRVVKKDVRGDEVVQKAAIVQITDAPGPIKKLFGDQTKVDEETIWKQGSDVGKVTYVPEKFSDRTRLVASMRIESAGEGKCKVVMTYDVEFKMFGVGGLVEKMLAKDLPDMHRKTAAYFNSHPYEKK